MTRPSEILRAMQRLRVPRGTDRPDLLALGAPPLHQVTDQEITDQEAAEALADRLMKEHPE